MNTPAIHPGQEQEHAMQRLAYVDGLRGVCALYVVSCHVLQQYLRHGFVIYIHAQIAVLCFMMISGFCLTLEAQRRSEGYFAFVKRRASRILPPYYAGIIFSLAILQLCILGNVGNYWSNGLPVTKESIAHYLLLIQDFTNDKDGLNKTYWFLPILFQLYLVFPMLLTIAKRMGAVPFFAGSVALSALPLILGPDVPMLPLASSMGGAFCIGIGSARLLAERERGELSARYAKTLTATVLCLYAVAVYIQPQNLDSELVSVATGLVCAFLLVSLALRDDPIKSFLEWKPVVFFGALSFSMYLTHSSMIDLVDVYVLQHFDVAPSTRLALLIPISVPAIVVVAYVFYRLVEKPSAAWSRRIS